MATDFHYVPLPPEAVSGNAVLRQTEQAINDIGHRVDQSGETSDEALQTAQQAQSTAEAAQSSAESALSTAQTAQTTATNAQASANAALSAAQTAQSSAQVAQDTAQTAQTTASTAVSTAQIAQAAVDQVRTDLGTTNQNLENLTGLVSSSAADIKRLREVQAVDTDSYPIDIDALYSEYATLYLTGSGVTNAPAGATTPLWLDVRVTDDDQHVTQECMTDAADVVFIRTGSIDSSDPESPVVSWAEWQTGDGVRFATEEDYQNQTPGVAVDPPGLTGQIAASKGNRAQIQIFTTSSTFTAPITGWYGRTSIGGGGSGGSGGYGGQGGLEGGTTTCAAVAEQPALSAPGGSGGGGGGGIRGSGGAGGGGGGGAGFVVTDRVFMRAGDVFDITIGAGGVRVASSGAATTGTDGAGAYGGSGGIVAQPGGGGSGGGSGSCGSSHVVSTSYGVGGSGGANGTEYGGGGGGGAGDGSLISGTPQGGVAGPGGERGGPGLGTGAPGYGGAGGHGGVIIGWSTYEETV